MSGIMPLINVPDAVQYGRIQARLVAFIADTKNDSDQIPDEIPLEGFVVLTPTVGAVRFPTTAPPRTAVVQALRCPIIGGDLYPPDTPLEGPLPDTPGVVVVASDQPVGLPDTVQWNAKFELVGARVQPESITFEVPSGGVVDLTTVIPATPTPGTVVVVSTVDRERAEDAASAAEAAADTAETAATVAVTAKTLAEGFAGDAEAARDQAAQAAAAQDTGWRDVSAALHEDCTGTLLVRRIGARVTAMFNITSRVTTKFMRIWQMPEGWRTVVNWLPIGMVPYALTGTALAVGPTGWRWLLDARRSEPLETDIPITGELSWLTNDAFPSPAAYPGTPA